MADEREVRKETDFWGNEKEVIYENNQRVGEIRTEERGGFLGFGAETVKVEYDKSGSETSYTKNEDRGGFLGFGSEPTQVRYDSSNQEIGQSRVEERGGFLGLRGHHVRVEYDIDGREVSQTNTELRGGFLGIGGDRRRITRYSTDGRAPVAQRLDSFAPQQVTDYRTGSVGSSNAVLNFSLLVFCIIGIALWIMPSYETGNQSGLAAVREPTHTATDPLQWGVSDFRTEQALNLDRREKAEIQVRLLLLKFDPKGIDGVLGPASRLAIMHWQRSLAIESSGYLNKWQFNKLTELTADLFSKWQSQDGSSEILANTMYPQSKISSDTYPSEPRSSQSEESNAWYRDERGLYCKTKRVLGAVYCQSNQPRGY